MNKRRDYVPDAPWIGNPDYGRDDEDEYDYDDYLADEEDRWYDIRRDEEINEE